MKQNPALRFTPGYEAPNEMVDQAYALAAADPLSAELQRWFEEGNALDPRGPGWAKYKIDPPRKMHAWHCGAKPTIESFDDFARYVGSGEGIIILGPGIYFATSEGTARRYCRYAAKPTLYEAEIDTTDYIDTTSGRPSHVRERVYAALDEAGIKRGLSSPSSFQYGRHDIGVLVWKLGRAAALKLLLKHGVRGALDWVHTFWEIAVFDPSTITVLSAAEQPAVKKNRKTSRRRRTSRR